MGRINVSWEWVHRLARAVAEQIEGWSRSNQTLRVRVYGIPRGGIYAAQAVKAAALDFEPGLPIDLVDSHQQADIYIDDIIDSGRTLDIWKKKRDIPFFTLCSKDGRQFQPDEWVSFPWERMVNETGPEDAILRLLQYIGEDTEREGLRDTPGRVVRSYAQLFCGYKQNPAEVMKVFEDGACDEMVLLKDIEFVSFCEHHLLPFSGVAHVAYLPHKRVIGVSKLARLVDIFARRLQIQERLTQQVSNALQEHLQPNGSACIIEAHHSCMSCRGVGKQECTMVTSSLLGAFREPEVRQELFSLIRK